MSPIRGEGLLIASEDDHRGAAEGGLEATIFAPKADLALPSSSSSPISDSLMALMEKSGLMSRGRSADVPLLSKAGFGKVLVNEASDETPPSAGT